MNLSRPEKLMPQEEMLEVRKSRKKLTIGLPKEIATLENRIGLVPNAVGQIVTQGHRVLIESGAGESSRFSDNEYSETGGEIVNGPEEVFQADFILKVAPLTTDEMQYIKKGQTVISSLQLSSRNKGYFKKLITKKTTAISYEFIKDKSGAFPVLHSMSEIAGKASVLIAAEYFSDLEYGRGSMLGGFPGITPTEVVILGAGTVGINATKTALGLGANVKIFDNRIYKLRRLIDFTGQTVFTSIMQPKVLSKALKTADVVICALYSRTGRTEYFIPEDEVRLMKQGAVIVDVSIDQGGCFETSRMTVHKNPVFKMHDVTHYCVSNIASKYPHTASYALSNYFTPVLLKIGNEGGLKNLLKNNYEMRSGVYMLNGTLTNKQISDIYDLPFQDIDLLMAAFE